MLKLFSKNNPNTNFKKVGLRSFYQFQPRLINALETIFTKYRNYDYTVPPDHILVKLIDTYGALPLNLSDSAFIDSMYDITPRLANGLGMTSEINKGKVFKGEFYNSNGRELIFLYSERFDLEEANDFWEDLEPVKVLRHPFLNTGLEIPNGKFSETTDEAVVIAINLPMLLFQYRRFYLFEEAVYRAGQLPRGVRNFVASYVLPNMLISHAEQVILNRFISFYKTGRALDRPVKHSVNVMNWGAALDRELVARAAVIRGAQISMETFLYATDGLYPDQNALTFTKLPNVAKTDQVNWLLAYARSKLVADMRSFTTPSLDANNLYEMRCEVILLEAKHVYRTVLPSDLVDMFETEMATATA